MFLRNRITGQVHDVPDYLVHGFHTAQEVDGFGEPLGLPFLAALAPMLTNILPAVLPAIGGLFKGGAPAPAPEPAPPPPPAPVVMSPPPPPPPADMPPEPIPPPRRIMMDRGPDDDMPPPRRGVDPMDAGGPPPGPGVGYRVKRRIRRRRRRALHPQVHGYGWWY
jgi:hypothetical protein